MIHCVAVKVVIAGGDAYVNHVLRTVVDVLSKKTRESHNLSWYLIPLGK